MIDWILQEMEKQPTRLFYGKELESIDPGEFARLRREKFLAYVQPDGRSDTYAYGRAKPLTVVNIRGQLYGIDEDEPEEDPVPLERSDLSRYRFCLDRFVDDIRAANNLSGAASLLDRRLYFMGQKTVEGKRVAFVLGLFDSDETTRTLLLTLPAQVGDKVAGVAVITPTYAVRCQQLNVELERLRVYVKPLDGTDNLTVDISNLLKGLPAPAPVVQFTAEQERDYDLYEYNCRLPIHLTGKIPKANTNEVLVGDTPVEVGDVPFLLFLRLVLELRRNKRGTVPKVDLRSEGYFGEGTDDQSINRLRNCFVRALGGLDPKDFIETTYRRKMVRVSVHPDLVSWDKERLSNHDHSRVRELVEQLAQASEGSSSLPA
jgi:hypothetical protein